MRNLRCIRLPTITLESSSDDILELLADLCVEEVLGTLQKKIAVVYELLIRKLLYLMWLFPQFKSDDGVRSLFLIGGARGGPISAISMFNRFFFFI